MRSFKIRVMSDRYLGISWECDRLKLGGCERSLFRNKLGER
ncbi:hypothetical protein [Cuspidothrix issatschenkoi]|nr:hypothetical protein [Cuspidothrix issatschenkoi]